MLLVAPALAVAQQESRSSQLAIELVKMLDALKLDAVAAKIEGDQYVGALYFPGSQLLVVKARYIVPERMDAQLQGKNYRDVYIDLNSASIKDSKMLIADLGANGLQPGRRNQPYDTVDTGGKSYRVRRRLGQGQDLRTGIHEDVPDQRRGIHADAGSARRPAEEDLVNGASRQCCEAKKGSPSGLPFLYAPSVYSDPLEAP